MLGGFIKSIFITAEIGINHNGDMSICKELIDVAVDAGCDAVKFQKRTIDIVYSNEILNSYRKSPWGETTREQKKGLEFSLKEYEEIDKYCKYNYRENVWDVGTLSRTAWVDASTFNNNVLVFGSKKNLLKRSNMFYFKKIKKKIKNLLRNFDFD